MRKTLTSLGSPSGPLQSVDKEKVSFSRATLEPERQSCAPENSQLHFSTQTFEWFPALMRPGGQKQPALIFPRLDPGKLTLSSQTRKETELERLTIKYLQGCDRGK